jgi:hypothetical protein
MHGDAGCRRLLPGSDIDVVEDLQVVREELQGHHEDLSRPGGAEPCEEVLHVRGEPLFGRVPGALIRKAPALAAEVQPCGDRCGGVPKLRDEPGVAIDDGTGQAVGREDDRNPIADLRLEACERLLHPLRERVDPFLDEVPGPGDAHVHVRVLCTP